MTLIPGTRLGPYEIVAPLGAGGMGEVHRARDTRLGRDVAVKALPAEFARDPERVARFEREAKLLASLNHPNIAGIHGLEEVAGDRYLVLEFIEGETLGARLARGPLPVVEALDVCRQVAAGVEAAHDAGVVHRDLKPGNVMLKPDGTVKVLDFGLAKGGAAHGASSSDPNLSASPTMTYARTVDGVILGTAAYMSPEQARGKTVDRRTDVWSFGCVLYECLTGRRVFEGETVSDLVARILEREPDWTALPAATPAWLGSLMRRCLTKDVKQRLQAIGEARIALERGGEDATAPGTPVTSRSAGRFAWVPWALAAVLGALALGRGLLPGMGASPVPERRVEIGFPAGQVRADITFGPKTDITVSRPVPSPDGRQLAIIAADSAGVAAVWLRALNDFEFRALKGTEGAAFLFWSPDSRSIGFIAGGALSRVSVENGTIQKLVGKITSARGADWGANGNILYTTGGNASIWRVPATGGTPVQVTQLDTTRVDASHRFPVWLPDGKHFLFALWSNNPRVRSESGGIYLASVEGGTPTRVTTDMGEFLALPSGHLVTVRNSGLVAIPFDLRTFRAGTDAIPIADDVRLDTFAGFLAAGASATGDIAFESAASVPPTDMAWLDRGGHRGEALGLRAGFDAITLSPDGARVVGTMVDATGLWQLWTADLARRTTSPLTRGQNDTYSPVWSPDGQRIAFANDDISIGDLFVEPASGTRPRQGLWKGRKVGAEPSDWSADGRYVFFTGTPRAGTPNRQVWMFGMTVDSARVLLEGEFNHSAGRLSPDGRWLAYVSDESGRNEVFVRSFPDLERKWQVSTEGGGSPHWRKDGRELVFLSLIGTDRWMSSASIVANATGVSIGEPQRLFRVPKDVVDITCSADHARFLALMQPAAAVEPAIRMVIGWNGARRK